MTNKLPHIIIFNPDQWRSDVLGHMGNPAAVTPVLDECARTDFVSFRNAFCQNPVCTPSRCSFMTGWYTHVRGHRTMHHMLHPEWGEPNLLKTLKDNGYFVWWGGKNDLTPGQHGLEAYCDVKFKPVGPIKKNLHGYDSWRGQQGGDNWYSFYGGRLDKEAGEAVYRDDDWALIQGAVEHIRTAPKDRPLCIYLPLLYPHPPYAVEDPYYSAIDRAKLPPRITAPAWDNKPSILQGISQRQNLRGWTEDRWTELRATYYGMCARVDDQFGRVLQALRDAGIYDDSAVFFLSDHGDFTGDYGLVEKTQNTFEDCLTRVPFLVKPPGGVACQARVSDALVELIDMPATIEAITGIEPRHDHFGRSLLPVLAGETEEHRDAVFCEGGRRRGERHCMELQSTAHTVPTGLYWPRVSLQVEEGPEHCKAVMCRTKTHKYVRRLYETDELYDLRADPGEHRNLINDPTQAGILAKLKDRMLEFYLDTGDVVPRETDRR